MSNAHVLCRGREKRIRHSPQINMINKTKQNWSTGEWVKVGFMKLKVVGVRSEFDMLPDIYSLESANGKKYEFIPHNGLYAI